jgi:hypothetical protein
MKTINLDYLLSVELNDKLFYMFCDDAKTKLSLEKNNKLVIDNIAYYKPNVKLTLLNNETIIKRFNSYDDAHEYYVLCQSFITNSHEIKLT